MTQRLTQTQPFKKSPKKPTYAPKPEMGVSRMSTHNKPSTQTDGKAMPELRLSVSLDPTSLQTLAVLLIDELQRLLTAHQPPASPQPPPTSTPPIKTQPDGRMDTKNAAIYLGMSR